VGDKTGQPSVALGEWHQRDDPVMKPCELSQAFLSRAGPGVESGHAEQHGRPRTPAWVTLSGNPRPYAVAGRAIVKSRSRSWRWGRWVEGSVYHAHWLPGRHLTADLATVEEVTVFARQQEDSYSYEAHMTWRLPGEPVNDILLAAPATLKRGFRAAQCRRLVLGLAGALAAHPDRDLAGPSAAALRELADAIPGRTSLWIKDHESPARSGDS
jgi:hypothetical protein